MTALPVLPRHRAIIAVDIEGSTHRTNMGRAQLRDAMYDLLEQALEMAGISEQYRDMLDRGDGVLVLVRPVDDLPKTTLLTTVIPTLSDLLCQLEFERPEHSFRLRAAIHSGEVHYDKRGVYGEDVDITCRLLDAPEVKGKLRGTTAPMVLVVSEQIYMSVIRHDYDGIDRTTYHRLTQVRLGDGWHQGWVHVPTITAHHQLAG